MAPSGSPDVPSPAELSREPLRDVLGDPGRKQAFVTPMFQHIAPRYDQFTRTFSFGMDRRWKAVLETWLCEHTPPPRTIVDLACGTGDLSFAACRAFRDASVTGVDAASRMIETGRARGTAINSSADFLVGDLAALPMDDDSVDVLLAGYGYRNVPSLHAALVESARVLRPGGALYVLDFYRPANTLWRELFLGYLHAAGALYGWLWHRAPVIYTYIAASIRAYVTAAEFSSELDRVGFVVIRTQRHLGGGIVMHEARRKQ